MQEAKTIDVSAELSKPQGESWDLVARWIALLAAHFRVEMSEPEIRIYCASLENFSADRLKAAMMRCISECQFMPKLKDIHDRMPEARKPLSWDGFVSVSDYYEPCGDGLRWHVFVDKNGFKRMRVERNP